MGRKFTMNSNAATIITPDAEAAEDAALWKKAEEISDEIASRMSPPDSLDLPPLLEERRWRWGIPDEAFHQHALYNWILVHQLEAKWDEGSGDTYNGTSILKTQSKKKEDKLSSSRGVIVSAGLSALDNLRSNGVDLGHIISFVKIAPWIRPTAYHKGEPYNLIVLRDGDLISSEDLQDALKAKKVKVTFDADAKQHFFVDENGKAWSPALPFVDDSY